MRILIVGTGIAGSAAALALHQTGFVPEVHEAHPDGGEDLGAFLTSAGNGMRALGPVSAARPVAERGFPLTALRLLDSTGAELAARLLGPADHDVTHDPRPELRYTWRYRAWRRATTS